MQEPKKEDYGWETPVPALGEEGGWTVEGGQEAYEKTMLDYKVHTEVMNYVKALQEEYGSMNHNFLQVRSDLLDTVNVFQHCTDKEDAVALAAMAIIYIREIYKARAIH